MPNESKLKTVFVALAVCMTASVLVASAAVLLRPLQEANIAGDRKKNILLAAGLIDHGGSVDQKTVNELFKQVEVRVVDLATGKFDDTVDVGLVETGFLDKDPDHSMPLEQDRDLGNIHVRANLQPIYIVRKAGRLERVVFPVRGKGLWSTLLGYIALNGDLNTVEGITFYRHAETAGLGAEIDNPKWKAGWVGKKLFDLQAQQTTEDEPYPLIEVIKGKVDSSQRNKKADYQIDGISGATLTCRGVMNLVRFWLGPDGFGPVLEKMRQNQSQM
jgi:Na+-transporting NADH:ubiquinone oxidoreductase subunit C